MTAAIRPHTSEALHTYAMPFRLGRETRALTERVWHAVQAFFRYIANFLYKLSKLVIDYYQIAHPAYIKPVLDDAGQLKYKLDELPWNQKEGESHGLYLFVHGYGGSPGRWCDYLRDAQEKAPKAHHLVPHVPHRGNCSLEDAAVPLLEVVRNYVEKYPGNPLFLFGFSNGTRLVTYIEAHLDLPPGSSLNIVSIAGVHEGSRVVNTMKRVARAVGMHPKLFEELCYQSTTSTELLALRATKASNRQGVQTRHVFFASTEDEAIQPVSTALPNFTGALYRVVHGHTHSSIMAAVRSNVWHDLSL